MKLDELAGVIYALEYHDENDTAEDALARWRQILASIDHPPWDDGKHCGDCTKHPCSCHQCFVEKTRARAQVLIDDWNNKDEQQQFKVIGGILTLLRSGWKRP